MDGNTPPPPLQLYDYQTLEAIWSLMYPHSDAVVIAVLSSPTNLREGVPVTFNAVEVSTASNGSGNAPQSSDSRGNKGNNPKGRALRIVIHEGLDVWEDKQLVESVKAVVTKEPRNNSPGQVGADGRRLE